MTGRVLSEEEIQAVSEHYEWDNFDDDAQATIHDLIATIQNLQEQATANASLWEEALAEKQREIEDRDKTIANKDDVIANCYKEIRRLRDQKTVLRESLLRSRGAGYNEDCIFCGMKDHMMDEALAKVRGDE